MSCPRSRQATGFLNPSFKWCWGTEYELAYSIYSKVLVHWPQLDHSSDPHQSPTHLLPSPGLLPGVFRYRPLATPRGHHPGHTPCQSQPRSSEQAFSRLSRTFPAGLRVGASTSGVPRSSRTLTSAASTATPGRNSFGPRQQSTVPLLNPGTACASMRHHAMLAT